MLNMKNSLLFFFFLLRLSITAQNLVPNPDFENHVSCDTGSHPIEFTPPWRSCRGSGYYFNSCIPNCSYCSSVPYNWAGSQNAFSGNGYAGLYTIAAGQVGTSSGELIGAPLVSSLVIGNRYFMSCYISRANSRGGRGASNNFGFKFSTVSFDANNWMTIDNFSHYHDSSIVIDSLGWTRISGSFIADSAYSFLALGNFYDPYLTDTADIYPLSGLTGNCAYYYIDYVCVTEDSSLCHIFTQINSYINKSEFQISPNPFTERIYIKTDIEEYTIKIYDLSMRVVLQQKFKNETVLLTGFLDEGIYIYSLFKENVMLKTGKIIKQ